MFLKVSGGLEARQAKMLSFSTSQITISKGKSMKNDAKTSKFRLRHHLFSTGLPRIRGEGVPLGTRVMSCFATDNVNGKKKEGGNDKWCGIYIF